MPPRVVKPYKSSRQELVADRIHSAAIRLLRRVRQVDAPFGIGPMQLSALSVLVFGGPKSLKELATIEQVTPATMSRAMAGLERAGFAHRATDPRDRRSLTISATNQGRVLLQRGRARRVAALAELFEPLKQHELDCLTQAAELIARVLRPPSETSRQDRGAALRT